MRTTNFIAIIAVFIVLFSSTLHAVDDQAILQVKLRAALNLEQQGKSFDAENAYKQLLENFPHNRQVISRLIYLFLRTNQLDSLEKFLEDEKDYLTSNYYEITKIELLIKKNQLDEAKKYVDILLKKAKVNISTLRQIAQVYQRYHLYDDAVELYLRARKESKNSIVFAQELAAVYQLQQRSYDALDEYLNTLDERTYKNVRYRLEKLDLSYEEIISVLEDRFEQEPVIELQELIGEFYILSGQYQHAFEIYKTLGNDALIKLATLAEKQSLYKLAIQCLSEVLKITEDTQTILYLEIKIGELYYALTDNAKAYWYYNKVIDHYQNTKASLPQILIFNAYRNLAYIELFDYKNPVQSQKYLENALDFASALSDKAELSILLSQCFLQQGDYLKSENILTDIIENRKFKTDVKQRAQVKLIETEILKGDFSLADTLSLEFFTHDYESAYVNDVATMYRTMQNELNLKKVDDSVKKAALSFLRDMYFNNNVSLNEDFVQLSAALQDSASFAYLTLQIADHFYKWGEYALAIEHYQKLLKQEDNTYREYVYYMTANALNQLDLNDDALVYYTDYLLEFPQGTFAPDIRLRIKKLNS